MERCLPAQIKPWVALPLSSRAQHWYVTIQPALRLAHSLPPFSLSVSLSRTLSCTHRTIHRVWKHLTELTAVGSSGNLGPCPHLHAARRSAACSRRCRLFFSSARRLIACRCFFRSLLRLLSYCALMRCGSFDVCPIKWVPGGSRDGAEASVWTRLAFFRGWASCAVAEASAAAASIVAWVCLHHAMQGAVSAIKSAYQKERKGLVLTSRLLRTPPGTS